MFECRKNFLMPDDVLPTVLLLCTVYITFRYIKKIFCSPLFPVIVLATAGLSLWLPILAVFNSLFVSMKLTKEYDKAHHTLENLRSSFGKHDPRQHALDSISQVYQADLSFCYPRYLGSRGEFLFVR